MVWGGDVCSSGQSSRRSSVDLEIGCLIDLATGLVTFTVNGKDIATSYQVLTLSHLSLSQSHTVCLSRHYMTTIRQQPSLIHLPVCLSH